MRVICPKCKHEFHINTRARLGSGTRKGASLKTLNQNKLNICDTLVEAAKRLTVREVQKILYNNNIRKWRRGDKDHPTGGWNYHAVQADLSLLVGAGFVSMTQGLDEDFDSKAQEYVSNPAAPKYWMDPAQIGYFKDVKDRNGLIRSDDGIDRC